MKRTLFVLFSVLVISFSIPVNASHKKRKPKNYQSSSLGSPASSNDTPSSVSASGGIPSPYTDSPLLNLSLQTTVASALSNSSSNSSSASSSPSPSSTPAPLSLSVRSAVLPLAMSTPLSADDEIYNINDDDPTDQPQDLPDDGKKEDAKEEKKTKQICVYTAPIRRSKSLPNVHVRKLDEKDVSSAEPMLYLPGISRTESILGRPNSLGPHLFAQLPNIIDDLTLQKFFKDHSQPDQLAIRASLQRAKKNFITHIGKEIKESEQMVKAEEKRIALYRKRLTILREAQSALAVDTHRPKNDDDLVHKAADVLANGIEKTLALASWVAGMGQSQASTEK